MVCNFKQAGHRVKQNEIWYSWASVEHIWDTFHLNVLRSFGNHSVHFSQNKYATQKLQAVDQNGMNFWDLTVLSIPQGVPLAL